VPLVVGGIAVPSVVSGPAPTPAGTVGMQHERFDLASAGGLVVAGGSDAVRIQRGSTLTFANGSRWLHVLGPGQDGRIAAELGAPVFGPRGVVLTEQGETYTTLRWMVAGTFHVTCALHPEMTVTVTVTAS
jgi:plastocyanin